MVFTNWVRDDIGGGGAEEDEEDEFAKFQISVNSRNPTQKLIAEQT